MVKDDQDSPQPAIARPGRMLMAAAVALTLAAGALLGTGIAFRLLHAQSQVGDVVVKHGPPSNLFRDWPANRNPDFVLMLTGQQNGYIMPCGCSRPQLGGLERRYNFVEKLRTEKGWTVVPLDLGDVAQTSGAQAMLKYVYSMRALKAMKYAAVGVGRNEMSLILMDVLANYTLNNPKPPVVFSNLANPDNFANLTSTQELVQAGALKVGVLSVVARPPKGKALPDPSVKVDSAITAIQKLLPGLKAKGPDLLVLLFHGPVEHAKACAKKFPEFQVILSTTDEEEPPGSPDMLDNTMLINIGHKGRYVGLVGVYRPGANGRPFDLHYQLVAMTEDYETPAGKDATNPILGLLEQYTREVRDKNYLAHRATTLHSIQDKYRGAVYVGSEKCKSCHNEAYKIWKHSPHATAYASLVQAKRPSLRQYDSECVKCHVVGFEHNSGFKNEKETPQLENNGCENCHGPGSIHVATRKANRVDPPELLRMMNPYKTPANEPAAAKAIRLRNLDSACQKCHDIDNDVHWDFEKKWAKIVH